MPIKKSKGNHLPEYVPTEEEREAYAYCVRQDIRISPSAIPYKKGEWNIEISLDGKRWTKAPYVFDKDTLWTAYYTYCKYYYGKRKNTS